MAYKISDPFLRQFGHLAIANILSNLMVPLAGIVDTAFLGHLPEIHHLAGVAIATVIFNVVYWSFGFLRMATTGLTAQAYGRGDRSGVQLVLLRNGLLAVVLSVMVVGLQVPIRQLGFGLLNAAADVQLSGQAFYDTRIWGTPAVLLNYVLLGWFLGQGQGGRVIALSMIANGGNILLDYWFIWQWGWASAGAGAATAISQGLTLIGAVCLAQRDCPWTRLWSLRSDILGGTALREMLQLNRDILIRTFAVVGSFALFTKWSAVLGTSVLAANTLLLQVVTLTSYFVDGLAFAAESFAGQFYGAGDRPRLRALLVWGLSLSVGLSLLIALLCALMPRSLLQVMTTHDPVLTEATRYVWWLLPTLGFGAIAFLLDGYFLGLTAGKVLRNSTLAAALGGFLPWGILAYRLQWSQGLWLALASFMTVRAMTLIWQVPATLRSPAPTPGTPSPQSSP